MTTTSASGWPAGPDQPQAGDSGAWCRVFPGTPDQGRQARRFLAGALGGHPATDAAVQCLAELVANAVTHSRSAQPGGTFAVRIRRAGSAIRVEVTDHGGPWGTRPDGVEHGRGLKMVRDTASRAGITAEGPDRRVPERRTVWFELPA